MNTTQVHIVLLGDSIFDNGAYVPVDEAVIHHLKRTLPPSWNATLVAHDGDVVDNIESQLAKVPPTTTHLVLSVGGNDALQVLPVMSLSAKTVHEALEHLTEIRLEFLHRYRVMLWQALSLKIPLAVCTIYDSVPGLSAAERTALTLFNDAIIREALAADLPLIDLRLICNESDDYSPISPIEPSAQGSHKIAYAIHQWLTQAVAV